MLENFVTSLVNLIVHFIESTRYLGIFLLMAVESANVPIPSEITMPFSGFLVARGELNFWLVVTAGAVGNLAGSLAMYWLGFWGGRPLCERYGRWLFLRPKELERAERWFQNWGDVIIFVSRLVPGVRTFISFPAGILRMKFWPFVGLTFLGSYPWSIALTYIGVLLGEQWQTIGQYFQRFNVVIGIGILGLILWYILKHIRR